MNSKIKTYKFSELSAKAQIYTFRYAIGMTEKEWQVFCEAYNLRFNKQGIQVIDGELIAAPEVSEFSGASDQ